MEEADGVGEGADVEVERVGEEVPFHFLALLLWEVPELGLCGLVSEKKTTC